MNYYYIFHLYIEVYPCDKCGIEFTTKNNVYRHQEKSCIRLQIINTITSIKVENRTQVVTKKKCPICSAVRLFKLLNQHKNINLTLFKF